MASGTPEFRARYEDLMDALSKPVSSYTLIYEPHLVPKTRGRKKRIVFRPHKNKPQKKATKKPKFLTNGEPQKKATKKQVANKFIPNVKTLTGTGMLDGVAVRYVNKAKQMELRGIIEGSSYLCGCGSCNYAKTVNAEEFERHAGCNTSHANNHIHFENGKSMHMLVQELNNTFENGKTLSMVLEDAPQNMLFHTIQTITASPINQKALSATWKGIN